MDHRVNQVSKGIKVKLVFREYLEAWTPWTWLVSKAKREILEKKGTLVQQEKKGYVGSMENQEFQEGMVNLVLQDNQDQKEIKAPRGTQEIQEFQGRKDQLVKWVCQEHLEKRVCLEYQVHQAHQGSLGKKVKKETKEQQVFLELAFQDLLVRRENQEEQAVRVCLETKVKRVMQEFQECRVLQVPKDPLALQDFQGAQASMEQRVKKDFLA